MSDLEEEAEKRKSDLAPRLISGTFLALDMKIETDIQELSITCLFSVTPGWGEWEQANEGKKSGGCLLAGAKSLLRVESRRSVSFGLGVPLGDGCLGVKDYVSSFQMLGRATEIKKCPCGRGMARRELPGRECPRHQVTKKKER